jgi:hypothetical protein
MHPTIIVTIVKKLYPIMRPILFKAINDPNSEWDDLLMDILDKILLESD